MRIVHLGMAITLAALSLAGSALAAPVETVLYRFTADGFIPVAGLIADKEGALYGTTEGGFGPGTVFKLTPPAKGQTAWTETVLYRFTAFPDGSMPVAGLIADEQGALYGTTEFGGSGIDCFSPGCGMVFKLTPPAKGQTAWTETVIHSFTGGSDGSMPVAGLIADEQGALYGTASGGVSRSCGGCGTVFKLTPPARGQTAWTETVLHTFTGGSDGGIPSAGLIAGKEGTLYGTTEVGGGRSSCSFAPSAGCGTVFKLTPPAKGQTAWTETVIHSFTGGSDGSDPRAGLIADKQGALYGTTVFGGSRSSCSLPSAGCGTVFKLTPPAKGQTAWTETVLYGFKGFPDGFTPRAGLIADKQGALYGTTQYGGGINNGLGGAGTVFKLTPPATGQTVWTETVIYSFTGGSDGSNPPAGLIADKQGALYGTTEVGGNNSRGTVFKLTPR
jgi:uncharacterized repeat protein (TIGR03803 family)